jgi:hypothetical protein
VVPWAVRAVAGEGYSDSVTEGETSTLAALPAAPPIHTISDIEQTGARVNWTPAGIRDIEVDGVIVKTVATGQFITGLIPGTAYSTRTRLDNPESEWTAAVPFSTLAPAVPIVMTLAADAVFPDKTSATGAPYSWSKDGAAASNSQWVLPAGTYDVLCNWVFESTGTAIPASDNVYPVGSSTGSALTPKPAWVDDLDGTFSATAVSAGRVTYSVPWDVRYYPPSSQPTMHPMTLKAGSTVTLTPVAATATVEEKKPPRRSRKK